MSKLLVSVIVATYNQDKFIGRCLRSLINQSLNNSKYEVIVINDGSNDKTKFALELFHDAIKIINNKKNIGLPASVNKGIKKAKGKYIIRVDSDDFVNENMLHFLSYFLETNNETDAVACDYLLLNDQEQVILRQNCEKKPIACGIMFRKRDLKKIGLYDESLLYHEETDLRIRFLKSFKITRLPLPLYRYRMHDNNMTKNKKEMSVYLKKVKSKHK